MHFPYSYYFRGTTDIPAAEMSKIVTRCWAEIWTHHIPDKERMRYVLHHSNVKVVVNNDFFQTYYKKIYFSTIYRLKISVLWLLICNLLFNLISFMAVNILVSKEYIPKTKLIPILLTHKNLFLKIFGHSCITMHNRMRATYTLHVILKYKNYRTRF